MSEQAKIWSYQSYEKFQIKNPNQEALFPACIQDSETSLIHEIHLELSTLVFSQFKEDKKTICIDDDRKNFIKCVKGRDDFYHRVWSIYWRENTSESSNWIIFMGLICITWRLLKAKRLQVSKLVNSNSDVRLSPSAKEPWKMRIFWRAGEFINQWINQSII